MVKIPRILALLGGLLLLAGPTRGQLDNRAFTAPTPGITRHQFNFLNSWDERPRGTPPDSLPPAGRLGLAVQALTFFKDNEYYNNIVEGYTLFGTQLNPQLVYYPARALRLEAGIFLQKDYGNPLFQVVQPTFRATWTRGYNQFIFGNLRPHLHHQYIEPLYDFEAVMLRPLEEGLQFRRAAPRLFLDVWVNWLRQQYLRSGFREEIAGGLSLGWRLTPAERRTQVELPFQFTARHTGGQLDSFLRTPVLTYFNYATGLMVRRALGGPVWQALRLNAYGLLFADNSVREVLPFARGHAWYVNGTLETRYADLMLSLWQGHNFWAPLGGPYYQSLASIYGGAGFVDPNRRLLLVRLLRDFRVSDAAAVTVHIEPVYDVTQRQLDFSFGVYLNFRQEWWLSNVGRRNPTP